MWVSDILYDRCIPLGLQNYSLLSIFELCITSELSINPTVLQTSPHMAKCISCLLLYIVYIRIQCTVHYLWASPHPLFPASQAGTLNSLIYGIQQGQFPRTLKNHTGITISPQARSHQYTVEITCLFQILSCSYWTKCLCGVVYVKL